MLDSSHRRRHVLTELRLWNPLLPAGAHILVEDTHAGGHPVSTSIGRGPWAAVNDFLAETDAFAVDEWMHRFFLIFFNPRGTSGGADAVSVAGPAGRGASPAAPAAVPG